MPLLFNLIPILALLIIVSALIKDPGNLFSQKIQNKIDSDKIEQVQQKFEDIKTNLKNSDVFIKNTSNNSDTVENQNIKKFESPHGFSFEYDLNEFVLENTNIILFGGKNIQAIGAVRYVEQEWCDQSGLPENCRPFIENPAIAFGVIGQSVSKVISENLKKYEKILEPVNIAGVDSKQFFTEIDGEGIVTILVPFNKNIDKDSKKENRTLIIQYTYDKVFNKSLYRENPNILDSKDQKKEVDRILSSLEL